LGWQRSGGFESVVEQAEEFFVGGGIQVGIQVAVAVAVPAGSTWPAAYAAGL
jgi:hypothetical protein